MTQNLKPHTETFEFIFEEATVKQPNGKGKKLVATSYYKSRVYFNAKVSTELIISSNSQQKNYKNCGISSLCKCSKTLNY